MSHEPTIASDMRITLTRCPGCRGTSFCYLDQYLLDDEQTQMARLLTLGHQIENIPVSKLKSMKECTCFPEEFQAVPG